MRSPRLLARALWGGVAAFSLACIGVVVACGTNVSTLYESDVRFERCMALDWQGDVDPQIRHGCWSEWVKYFTRGQTRDRIEYATREVGKLDGADSAVASASAAAPMHAIPEPTSVFTPPPSLMTQDAGPEGDGGELDGGRDGAPSKTDCEANCAASSEQCEKTCKSATCLKGCAGQRVKCLTACK